MPELSREPSLGGKKVGSASGEAWAAAKIQTDLAKKKKGAEAEALAEIIETRNANLDRILEAYEEADDDHKFMEYMLETSDMPLTKESLKKNSTIDQYLKSKLKEQALEPSYYEGFVRALPTEQDYANKALGREAGESVEPKKTKVMRVKKSEEPSAEVAKVLAEIRQMNTPKAVVKRRAPADLKELPAQAGEVNNENKLGKRVTNKNVVSRVSYEATKSKAVEINPQYANELKAVESEEAYVKAYKEYDPRFTEELDDETIIVTRPPWLAIGKAARELKRLYGVMLEARKKMAGEFSLEPKTKEALSASAKESALSEAGLSAEAKAALAETNEVDEVLETLPDAAMERFLKRNERYDIRYGAVRTEGVRYKSEGIRHDLLEAYKDMGVLIGEGAGGNAEELLSKKPPFSYIFSARGRKARDLYDQYVKKLEEEK